MPLIPRSEQKARRPRALPWRAVLAASVMLLLAAPANAQQDQDFQQAGWPCVSGRAVDSSYVDITESTGGLLFLLQPNEATQSASLMSATLTHPQTLARAVGELRGQRVIRVPVDGSVDTLFIAASMQCRQRVTIVRPDGVPVTIANAAEDHELTAGRLTSIEAPPPGEWIVTLAGQGLYTVSVLASTRLAMSASVKQGADSVRADTKRRTDRPREGPTLHVEITLTQPIASGRMVLIDAAGERMTAVPLPATDEGTYGLDITPPASRFRVSVEGSDADGWEMRRVYPNLFSVR